MKTFALSALLFFVVGLGLSAQTIEDGFEEWPKRTGPIAGPIGWVGPIHGVGTDSIPYAGESALLVHNWYSEVIGFVVNGEKSDPRDRFDRAGVPIEFVPEKLTGYYKYNLGENKGRNDSAAIHIMLKRYNNELQRVDTVAWVRHLLPPAEAWIPFSIDIPLRIGGVEPDSMVIGFYSSNPARGASCAHAYCCYFSVDEIALTSTSGVSYPITSGFASARVVPNPIRHAARITFDGDAGRSYRIRFFDVSGAEAASADFTGPVYDPAPHNLSPGVYYFSITDAENRPVATGEFVVE